MNFVPPGICVKKRAAHDPAFERIEDMLLAAARACGDKIAIVDGDIVLSYATLGEAVRDFASSLQAHGLAPGDRVSIFLDKTSQCVISLYGAWLAGAIVVPINESLRPHQVYHILTNSGSRFLVTDPRKQADLDAGNLGSTVILDADAVAQPLHNDLRPPLASRDERAAILYTSGSTGLPKGILISHANLLAGSRIVARYLELKPDERIISLVPFSFDYGLNQLLTAVYITGTLVLHRSLFPSDICRALNRHEVTGMAAVPTLWLQLLQRHSPFAQMSFPHLRYITNTGGTLPVFAVKRYRELLPHVRLYLMYGLSESFRSSYLPPEYVDLHPDSIGRAIPECDLFVVSAEGNVCAPGEVGELVHRGPTVALCYWNDPESTAKVFRPDPFDHRESAPPVVYSGDLVKADEDGLLFFVSRRDQLIKSHGYRISPDEVERIILQSGMVNEVVVKGVPDEVAGAVVMAHCVPVSASAFSEADFLQYCRAEMPRYMVPKTVHLHEGFPRTATGKIDRKAVGS
jgi:acyl-CoA ligase (AMP-forming) (exosortase A-associated)